MKSNWVTLPVTAFSQTASESRAVLGCPLAPEAKGSGQCNGETLRPNYRHSKALNSHVDLGRGAGRILFQNVVPTVELSRLSLSIVSTPRTIECRPE